MAKPLVSIEDTRFIFKTNFAGDPERDKFGSDTRQANIIIPDVMKARELIDEGFNIKMTKPGPDDGDEFIPQYYAKVIMNYDSEWPPKIYLVSGDNEPELLDEDSVEMLDKIYISNVDAVLSKYFNKRNGRWSLYVKTMYVEQSLEDDPFAAKYARRGRRFDPAESEYPEERPFR